MIRANELLVWGCHRRRDGRERAFSAVRGDPVVQDGVEPVDNAFMHENRMQRLDDSERAGRTAYNALRRRSEGCSEYVLSSHRRSHP